MDRIWSALHTVCTFCTSILFPGSPWSPSPSLPVPFSPYLYIYPSTSISFASWNSISASTFLTFFPPNLRRPAAVAGHRFILITWWEPCIIIEATLGQVWALAKALPVFHWTILLTSDKNDCLVTLCFPNSPLLGYNSPPLGYKSPPLGDNSPPLGDNSPPLGDNSSPLDDTVIHRHFV